MYIGKADKKCDNVRVNKYQPARDGKAADERVMKVQFIFRY